ncbi:hypothetical protein D3C72_842800 [compost metagenome]
MSRITMETRRESYREVWNVLAERHQQCLQGLTDLSGRATANELAMHLYRAGTTPYFSRNYVHPRLHELIRMGFVEVVGKKKDEITGKSVAIYHLKEVA